MAGRLGLLSDKNITGNVLTGSQVPNESHSVIMLCLSKYVQNQLEQVNIIKT